MQIQTATIFFPFYYYYFFLFVYRPPRLLPMRDLQHLQVINPHLYKENHRHTHLLVEQLPYLPEQIMLQQENLGSSTRAFLC